MSFAQHFFTIVNMCSGARRCSETATHSLYSSPQPSYLISAYGMESVAFTLTIRQVRHVRCCHYTPCAYGTHQLVILVVVFRDVHDAASVPNALVVQHVCRAVSVWRKWTRRE